MISKALKIYVIILPKPLTYFRISQAPPENGSRRLPPLSLSLSAIASDRFQIPGNNPLNSTIN